LQVKQQQHGHIRKQSGIHVDCYFSFCVAAVAQGKINNVKKTAVQDHKAHVVVEDKSTYGLAALTV